MSIPTKNADAPAFGHTSRVIGPDGSAAIFDTIPGLTKREYIAALALQGWLASWPNGVFPNAKKYADLAEESVNVADALLAELEKTQ